MFLPAERRPTIAESEIEHWKTGMTSSNSPSNTLEKKTTFLSFFLSLYYFICLSTYGNPRVQKWNKEKMFCYISVFESLLINWKIA